MSRKTHQIIPGAGHLGQPQPFQATRQTLGALAQADCPLSGKDRARQMTLGGKKRQRLPALDEGSDPLRPQELNPALVGRASLFSEPGIRKSRMSGNDGRGTEAFRGGLDEPQRDPSPERVTDNPLDAGRQFLEKGLDLVAKGSEWIAPAAVTGEIDRQQGAILVGQRSPILRAAGEAM